MRQGASRRDPRGVPADARVLWQYPIIVRSSSCWRTASATPSGKYDSYFLATRAPRGALRPAEEWCARSSPAPWARTPSPTPPAWPRPLKTDGTADPAVSGATATITTSRLGGSASPTIPLSGRRRWTRSRHAAPGGRAGDARRRPGRGGLPAIVALDAPLKRPLKGFEDARRFAQPTSTDQRREQRPEPSPCSTCSPGTGIDWAATRSRLGGPPSDWRTRRQGQKVWLLTFDTLLSEGRSPHDAAHAQTIEGVYATRSTSSSPSTSMRRGRRSSTWCKCRPLQTRETQKVEIPQGIGEEQVFFATEGHFMGGRHPQTIRRIILVDSEEYIRCRSREVRGGAPDRPAQQAPRRPPRSGDLLMAPAAGNSTRPSAYR